MTQKIRFSRFFSLVTTPWKARTAREKRNQILLLFAYAIIIAVIIGYTQFGTFFKNVRSTDFIVGQVAERDLIVDRDIEFVDENATFLKREARMRLVSPIFVVRDEITKRALHRFDLLIEALSGSAPAEKVSGEKIYLEIQSVLPGVLSREEVERIVAHKGIAAFLGETGREALESILTEGIVTLPKEGADLLETGFLEIWRWNAGIREQELVSIDSIPTIETLDRTIAAMYADLPLSEREILSLVVRKFAQPNTFFDPESTRKNRERIGSEVEPVRIKLLKGEIIVQKGFIVSEEDMEKIEAMGAYTASVNVNTLVGNLILLLILALLSLYLLNPPIAVKRISREKQVFLLFLFLFFYICVFAALALSGGSFTFVSGAVLPTACISMLVAIVVNYRIGVLFTLLLTLPLFVIMGIQGYGLFLFCLLSGFAGTRAVVHAERRLDLIRAGIWIAASNTLVSLVLGFLTNATPQWFLNSVFASLLNGFGCAMLNLGTLPIFEHVMNLPTTFRLIELSDTNAPILKRMLTLAPGTYSHSLNVSNLAESACRDIGANPLLARVSAYYHDIGKIDQAEYFIENQMGGNKHEELKPSLSAAVIKSHVKIGVEKAKELGLPREVIDIIAQHHGKGIIHYFYERARSTEKNGAVNPEDYSYSEPPPNTKEAAVLMLADICEAASRTLNKPTIARLDKFVWDIIMSKFESGQLNETELTFRDLETIKKRFVQILAGHFHTRIEYPDIKKIERNVQKREAR